MGKPWENHVKIINYGKIIGESWENIWGNHESWENHGKINGKSSIIYKNLGFQKDDIWNIHGKSWENHLLSRKI